VGTGTDTRTDEQRDAVVITRICSNKRCGKRFEGNPATADGWCHVCYTRWYRHGKNPSRVIPDPLPHRRLAAYDDFIQTVMLDPDLSNQAIADWIGVCRRTVIRYQARLVKDLERMAMRMTTSSVPRYVLWLDGGEDTGYALYDRRENRIFIDELGDFEAVGRRLEAWLSSAGARTAVGAERYVVTVNSVRKDPNLSATQVYGMARWLALRHKAWGFVGTQNSSDALSFATDDLLRAVGWYKLGMPHGNDAARHVLKYLFDQRALPAVLSQAVAKLVSQTV
jgi:hypothetical protein